MDKFINRVGCPTAAEWMKHVAVTNVTLLKVGRDSDSDEWRHSSHRILEQKGQIPEDWNTWKI
jgi:hypothetical protein